MKTAALGVLALVQLTATSATLHVWQNSLSPAVPFATWETAANNIQDAIDAASAGDTVLVTNGVYASGSRLAAGHMNRISIDKAIVVKSVHGPNMTHIVGASQGGMPGPTAMRSAYVGPGALLNGFTLTNGFTGSHSSAALGRYGGGAFLDSAGTISNCVLSGNSAYADGGGVYGGAVYNCIITGNSAHDDGGGVDRAVIYNCIISGNTASDDGGGVDDSSIYNSVLRDNSAQEQGGGAFESSAYNCTIVGNSARRGGGLCGRVSSVAFHYRAVNCIVYHNRGAAGPNHFAMDVSYSCTTPLPLVGFGNISADPQLASDYHLSAQSPCIGAGIGGIHLLAGDIDGQPFGNPPCIGADQLTPGTTMGDLSVVLQVAYTNIAVGYSVAMAAEVSGQTLGNRWTFGDETVLSNRLEATHAWNAPGTYEARLTAFNDEHPSGTSSTVTVSVVEAPAAYVNAANAAPVFPYATWATAATSIQDAIGAGTTAGRVVWVTDGTYTSGRMAVHGELYSKVALTNGVIVQSMNGPGSTVIARVPGEAARCAFVGAGSMLSGFTLTNGMTLSVGDTSRNQGGGGAWCERGGVVSNCWVLGNVAVRDGGGIHGGTAIDCLIAGNRAGDDGGGADSARLIRCVLRGNTAGHGGGGADESRLEACTLEQNSSSHGAAVDDTTVIDCTLTEHRGFSYGIGHDSVFIGCNIISNTAVIGVIGSMLDRCTIKRNVAITDGGGASYSVLANCLLASNISSNRGGGLHLSLAYNCTIALNEADQGGGIFDSTAHNSIVYFNEGGNYNFNSVLSNSCTFPLPGGESWNNISDDPRFIALLGDNFRLRSDSPCIDRADWPEVASPIDLDGGPRFVEMNAHPPRADLGAYEFQPLRFLAVHRRDQNVLLVWNSARNVRLEASPALQPVSWTEVPEAAGRTSLELPASGTARFFRLVETSP